VIAVIEGPSAAGKTTWCRSHFPDITVRETPADIAAPGLHDDPAEVGRFWVEHAIDNWQCALRIESEHGLAVCDGDPFHLYYSWALWKSGALPKTLFDIESGLYRRAFQEKLIGFADHVLWLDIPIHELRRRAQADPHRLRKRHEMNLALVPWMQAWFEHRERLLPGTVRELTHELNVDMFAAAHPSLRYDTASMEELLVALSSIP
jgi:hypothetical protein